MKLPGALRRGHLGEGLEALLCPGLAGQEDIGQPFHDPAKPTGFDGRNQPHELAVGQLIEDLKLLGSQFHGKGVRDLTDHARSRELHNTCSLISYERR